MEACSDSEKSGKGPTKGASLPTLKLDAMTVSQAETACLGEFVLLTFICISFADVFFGPRVIESFLKRRLRNCQVLFLLDALHVDFSFEFLPFDLTRAGLRNQTHGEVEFVNLVTSLSDTPRGSLCPSSDSEVVSLTA